MKMVNQTEEKGSAFIISLIFLFVLMILIASFLSFASFECRATSRSYRREAAISLAEAGIDEAIWELSYGGADFLSSEGWTDVNGDKTKDDSLKTGDYTVRVQNWDSKTNDDPPPEIMATGYVPSRDSPKRVERTAQIILEKPTLSDDITQAVAAGGSVKVKGKAEITNDEGGPAIQYPGPPYTYESGGSATVEPEEPVKASFPTFEETFGISEAVMQSIADAMYNNPAKNVPLIPTGITWINGDAKFTRSDWDGEGILIVTGDLEVQGGDFDGVIYVMGSLVMKGNIDVEGAILVRSTTEVTFPSGNPEVEYDSTIIDDKAGGALPWQVRPGSWQE